MFGKKYWYCVAEGCCYLVAVTPRGQAWAPRRRSLELLRLWPSWVVQPEIPEGGLKG